MSVRAPYEIRRMTPADIPPVARLEQEIFSDPWPQMAFVQELYFNTAAHYFVLEVHAPTLLSQKRRLWHLREEKPVRGYIGMRVDEGKGHISTLGIHADCRGQGFGELLLITALERALKLGATEISLEVRVPNERAQRLYRKYGFKIVSRLRRYYRDGTDAYLMEVRGIDVAYGEFLAERRQTLEIRLRRALTGEGRNHG